MPPSLGIEAVQARLTDLLRAVSLEQLLQASPERLGVERAFEPLLDAVEDVRIEVRRRHAEAVADAARGSVGGGFVTSR